MPNFSCLLLLKRSKSRWGRHNTFRGIILKIHLRSYRGLTFVAHVAPPTLPQRGRTFLLYIPAIFVREPKREPGTGDPGNSLSVKGQIQTESASGTFLTCYFHPAVVAPDDFCYVAEPQSVALDIMSITSRHPEKFLKYFLLICRWDADSFIPNNDDHFRIGCCEG